MQPVDRLLGLHCLLYLSADRILPNSGCTRGTDTSVWPLFNSVFKTSVSVPCRPTVEVVQRDLESRLLMAALLDCWEMGRVKLRLAEPSDTRWKGYLGSGYGRVHVVPLAGPALDGLCGRVLERLERKGEQGAEQLLRAVINSSAGGGSVIAEAGRYLTVAEPSSLPGAAGAIHRSTVRRPSVQSGGRGGPGCLSGAAVPRWPCPSTRSRPHVHTSTCPVSGDYPVSAQVSTHPLSNVQVWTSRCPGVGCPRVRVRVRGVCTGDFMERVGAAGSHTARRDRVWPPCRIRERHAIGLSQGGFSSGLSGVAADASSGCRRRPRSVVAVEDPRPSRLVAASLPSWTATCACGRGEAATSGERRPLDAGDALTCSVGGGGEGI
jgi:hypothetical protein